MDRYRERESENRRKYYIHPFIHPSNARTEIGGKDHDWAALLWALSYAYCVYVVYYIYHIHTISQDNNTHTDTNTDHVPNTQM